MGQLKGALAEASNAVNEMLDEATGRELRRLLLQLDALIDSAAGVARTIDDRYTATPPDPEVP